MRFTKTSRSIIIMLAVVMLSSLPAAYAADTMHLFMHDDHDALIIGEIIKVEGEVCAIAVTGTISGKAEKDRHKPPETVICDVSKKLAWYPDRQMQVGEYVIASVNHESADTYVVANGAYLIDSTDKETLSLVLPDDADEWTRMDAAALECFIHSDGEYRDFSFDGSTYEVKRYLYDLRTSPESVIIYRGGANASPSPAQATPSVTIAPTAQPTIQPTVQPSEVIPVNANNEIIGGADAPTTIVVAGFPWRTAGFVAFIVAVVVAVVCVVLRTSRKK